MGADKEVMTGRVRFFVQMEERKEE